MKTIISLCFLFLLIDGLFTAGISTAYKHEDREFTKFEEKTVTLLKKKFPGELLNKDLETLRELSDSDEYVNFLSKKYPEQAPFTTFQDFFHKVLLPKKHKELYFNLLFKKQLNVQRIEDVEDDEFFVAYAYMATYWTMGAFQRGGDISPSRHLNSSLCIGQYIIAKTPKGRKLLERRLGIDPITKDLPWILILDTFDPLMRFSTSVREEDEHWIKILFNKYGQSDGMLRLVVQDPMLFDRILYTFSTDTTFLKWLYNPIDVDGKNRKR